MIVPMEKVTLLLPKSETHLALEALRALGVMHIQPQRTAPGPEQSGAMAEEMEVSQLEDRLRDLTLPASGELCQISDNEIPEAAARAFAEVETASLELEKLEPVLAALRPWGEFDPALPGVLEKRGVYVRLCSGTAREQEALSESGHICIPLASAGRKNAEPKLFAVVSDRPLTGKELPVAEVPLDRPLSAYEAEAAALRERRDRARATLAKLKASIPRLEELLMLKREKTEFLAARDSMLSCGDIAGISGFVPEENLPSITEAAHKYGWGLVHAPADPEDAVPTLLKKPRWTKLLDPMMDFLTLSPGYNEADVSIPVLIFLTIFFGILIADAVYGLLFLIIAAAVLLTKGRTHPAVRLPTGLFLLFSVSALIWGILTGNYGGFEGPGLPYLAEGPEKDNHMKLVCFAIGAIHLSVGHLLRIFREFSFRHTLGQIGWIMVLFGNFMLITFLLSLIPGPFPQWVIWNYAVALVLIGVGEIDIHNISTILSCPLEVLSSFSDILSYIRLFAVCLAGFYLAKVFDGIAMGMMHSVTGCIFGSILLLLGHLMNIALGGLAILVHGVRLNTLEFSAHSQIRWAGFPFNPFRKKTVCKTP
ncbi:MAG: V-type ATP synthase subunit I [Lentisphaerae bacterium ADurb.Bin242]|nr:MAG: V-type ATP synthase subunit I [Lentisphaerae bacterium ADurb.Bin242]